MSRVLVILAQEIKFPIEHPQLQHLRAGGDVNGVALQLLAKPFSYGQGAPQLSRTAQISYSRNAFS
jgi:hypothetical protein